MLTTKEKIEVMQSFAECKKVLAKLKNDIPAGILDNISFDVPRNEWFEINNPLYKHLWNWEYFDFKKCPKQLWVSFFSNGTVNQYGTKKFDGAVLMQEAGKYSC